MKKLLTPTVNDEISTTDTANNARLNRTSYPYLLQALQLVLDSYQQYDNSKGNALHIHVAGLNDDLKKGLLKNYNSPPNSLAFIKQIRASSPTVCPMCGSLKTTSLDHVLPKEDYPEFTVYSKNLVPACDCNTKRGKATKNTATGGRVLHPYFDNVLLHRQLSCSIVPRPDFPNVDIRIAYVDPTGPLIDSLKFHVKKVVLPSGLISWLSSRWSSLVEFPGGVIHTLPSERITGIADLRVFLEDALQRYDRSLGTPNNWESILIHGLIHSAGVLQWLLDRHNLDYS